MRMDFNLKALCLVSNQYLYGIQYINNMMVLLFRRNHTQLNDNPPAEAIILVHIPTKWMV